MRYHPSGSKLGKSGTDLVEQWDEVLKCQLLHLLAGAFEPQSLTGPTDRFVTKSSQRECQGAMCSVALVHIVPDQSGLGNGLQSACHSCSDANRVGSMGPAVLEGLHMF